MPLLNGWKLIIHSEKGIATLDDIELPLVKDHDEPPRISSISRNRPKTNIWKNEITELYLATAKTANEPSSVTTPTWIKDEFSDVFLNGLPPERKVVCEIPLYPDSPAQFGGIFRLSPRTSLSQLLKDGKISPSISPYRAPVLFAKKEVAAFECTSITVR
jgi:hypothetical protein